MKTFSPSASPVTEIALYMPEIPQNTGNIARLMVCTGSRMHIIGKPSFSLDEAAVRRAGLDYWKEVDLMLHEDWPAFEKYADDRRRETGMPHRILLLTRFGKKVYSDYNYDGSEIMVFGRETSGIPEEIVFRFRETSPDQLLRIPVTDRCRSLNLGNTVTMMVYESLRQRGFPGQTLSWD
jgi:tRNA (cytidine/uridine-2'-O-)-methyltransferase